MHESTHLLDHPDDYARLAGDIKLWGQSLGFQKVAICDTQLEIAEQHLAQWLAQGYHGDMEYMARHGGKRSRPEELVPGTLRVISVSMDYYPAQRSDPLQVLTNGHQGYISRYALGRDYHKLLRSRLKQLAERVSAAVGPHHYRVFTDSAPVLEKPLAAKAGVGWAGKHTLLLRRNAGSWFFLGEIYTDLPLPVDSPVADHCGSCTACIEVCPTRAIVAPYVLDARRCISYLTIEYHGSLPLELRPRMGNRIFGCDDCQLVCPWNRFATLSAEPDFTVRHALDAPDLVALFNWSEAEFLKNTEGSAIRRSGYLRWLRNIAVALGNAPPSDAVVQALRGRLQHESEIVREHVRWALQQHVT